jgi:hypothetical protein
MSISKKVKELQNSLNNITQELKLHFPTQSNISLIRGKGQLYGISKTDGRHLWTIGAPYKNPVFVEDKKIIYCAEGGDITTFNRETGKRIRSRELAYSKINSLLLEDNVFYASTIDGDLAAFDKLTLKKRWEKELPEGKYELSKSNDNLYIFNSNKLLALNSDTGNYRWDLEGTIYCAHADFENEGGAYLSLANKNGEEFRKMSKDGLMLWRKEGQFRPTKIAGNGNRVYLGTPRILALDSNSGDKLWDYWNYHYRGGVLHLEEKCDILEITYSGDPYLDIGNQVHLFPTTGNEIVR